MNAKPQAPGVLAEIASRRPMGSDTGFNSNPALEQSGARGSGEICLASGDRGRGHRGVEEVTLDFKVIQ